MCAGATSMPAVSVGRMTSVSDRATVGEDVGHRSLDGVEVDAEAGGEIRLRVHVDAQDAVALFGEGAGEVDRRRRLADAALLVGDRDHVRHRGITSGSGSGGDGGRIGEGSECRHAYPARTVRCDPGYPHGLRVVHRICGYVGMTDDGRSGRDAASGSASECVADADYDAAVLAQRHRGGPATVPTNEERLDRLDAMRAEATARWRRDARSNDSTRSGKLTARERLELLLDAGLVRRARCVRHASRHRVRPGRAARPRRRRRHRPRHDRRPARLRLQPGLHGLRRIAVRGLRREDLQGHGPRDEGRRADHRAQRFGRRANPGRRRVARRLRRHLPAQRPGVRRRAADLGGHGAVRRRRGVLAGDHRLHDHGRGHELHVRDRAERREDRDPRGGRLGIPRRRDDAHDEERRRAPRGAPTRPRRSTAARRILALPAAEQPGGSAARRDDRSGGPHGRGARPRRARRPARCRTTCTTSSSRIVDDGDVPRDPAGVGAEHHRRLRATRRPERRHRRAAAGGPRRRARHRRVDQGRAVRPDLRLLQRPAASRSSTCPGSCPASRRSTAGSSGTARSCCTPTARRPSRS